MPAKVQLKWIKSYETVGFDTPDGDLGEDEYAEDPEFPGTFAVRSVSKTGGMFERVGLPVGRDVDLTGKRKVSIIGKAYYDEFLLPDGRVFRRPSTAEAYWEMCLIPDRPQPSHAVEWPAGEVVDGSGM